MIESTFLKWILEAFEYDRNIFMFRRNVGAAKYEKANGKKGFIRFAEAGQSDLWGWMRTALNFFGENSLTENSP